MALATLQGCWDIQWRTDAAPWAAVRLWGDAGELVLCTNQRTKKEGRWCSNTVSDETLHNLTVKEGPLILSLPQCLRYPTLASNSLCTPILIIYIILRGREEGEEAPTPCEGLETNT